MEARYERNLGPLTREECLALGQKRVLVAGCGGLGGYVLEHLLRLGVGAVTVCDGDVFQESNLNRQLLCTTEDLGRPKVEAAARRAAQVNPAVSFRAVPEFLTARNAQALLSGCDLALDALDNVDGRRALGSACAALGVPLVHGAVQGWCAQVAVVLPGSGLLDRLYSCGEPPAGPGVLSPIPALCASLQCAEAVKLLCGRASPLSGRLLWADLLEQDFQTFSL